MADGKLYLFKFFLIAIWVDNFVLYCGGLPSLNNVLDPEKNNLLFLEESVYC